MFKFVGTKSGMFNFMSLEHKLAEPWLNAVNRHQKKWDIAERMLVHKYKKEMPQRKLIAWEKSVPYKVIICLFLS